MHGCTPQRRAVRDRAHFSVARRPGPPAALIGLVAAAAAIAIAPVAGGDPPPATGAAALEKLDFQGDERLLPAGYVEEHAFPDGTRVRLAAAGGGRVPESHWILITLPDGTRLGPASLPPVNVIWHPDVWRGDVDGDGEDEFLYDCGGVPNGRQLLEARVPRVTVLDPRGSGPDRALVAIDVRSAALDEITAAIGARRAAAAGSDAAVDLAAPFAAAGVRGSAIILPASADVDLEAWEHDPAANDRRSSPASTAKIPHAIAALRLGAITGLNERFAWNGRVRSVAAWNRDLTVAEAIQVSAVWVFEAIAERITATDYQDMFTSFGCGSARAHDAGAFWLDGTLAISPREQVLMLRRLHGRDPWVGVDHRRQDVLRQIRTALPTVSGDGWTLRYKTGWAQDGPVDQGWCVGWVERRGLEPVYVAIRIDMPDAADAAKRVPLTLACLRAAGALPSR